MPTMDGELACCVEDEWKTSDKGPTSDEQTYEESKVRELTEALILCTEENLKMAQQLMVERQHFSLVIMETRKLRLEVLDWRTVVDILVAEINVLFSRTSVRMDKKPVSAAKTEERKCNLTGWEEDDKVKPEPPKTMPIDDSPRPAVDDNEVAEDSDWMDRPIKHAIFEAEPIATEEVKEVKKRKKVKSKSAPKDLPKRRRGRPPGSKKKDKPPPQKRVKSNAEASFDKSVHGYQCKMCKTVISAKQYLAQHLFRMHKEEPTWYTCEFCGKSFKVRWKVAAHVKHMHLKIPRKRLMCDICGKSFTDKSSLNHHRKGHFEDRPYLCDICGKGYKTQRILTSHKKSHEQGSVQEPKEYKCKECSLVTTDEEAWAEHLKIHPKNEHRKLKCKVCFMEFSHQVLLGKHMKTHPELPRFQCDQCEKDFGSESALKTHREGHSGELKFSCDICNKKFVKRQAHFFHKKWHHKKCDTCGVMFANRIALEEHSFVHTGIPPYECPACSMKFINRRLFWKHKLTHDELKPFVCPCGSRFVNSTHLAGHQKLHAKLGPIIVPRGNKSSTTFVRKKKSGAGESARPLGNFPVETVFGERVLY